MTRKDGISFPIFDRKEFFFQEIYERLEFDFKNVNLRNILYKTHDIREIEVHKTIILKSSSGVIAKNEFNERLGIGELEPNLLGPDGTGWVLVRAFQSAPQPWEVYNTINNPEKSNDDK